MTRRQCSQRNGRMSKNDNRRRYCPLWEAYTVRHMQVAHWRGRPNIRRAERSWVSKELI